MKQKRIFSKSHREKLRNAAIGRQFSDATKALISRRQQGHIGYMLGKHQSDITKKKIGDANRGKKKPPRSEIHRIRLGNANRGKHHSDTTKKKMHDAMLGKKLPPFSDIHKQKLSIARSKKIGILNARFGKHHTEASKQKMREAALKKQNKHFANTEIEIFMQKELHKRKILFKTNKVLCKTARVDILIPSLSLVIQCDGCYYHGCEIHHPGVYSNKKATDIKQDTILKTNGFKVYRFWEHDIRKSAEECVNSIVELKILSSTNL